MPPAIAPLPLSLLIVSVAGDLVLPRLFRAVSKADAIRLARRAMYAHLLELRLFGDEPGLVWRAQFSLLKANRRYIAAVLPGLLAVAIPSMLLVPRLEAIYGWEPPAIGSRTTLTVRMRQPLMAAAMPQLTVPPGVIVETPAVRVPRIREISWRLLVTGKVSEPLRVQVGGVVIRKRLFDVWGSFEWPGPVQSIEIGYRPVRYAAFGLKWPWEGWFLAVSLATAVVVKWH